MNRDIILSAIVALLLHTGIFFINPPLTSQVIYDVEKASSSVQVSLVKPVRVKKPDAQREVKKKVVKKPPIKKERKKPIIKKTVKPKQLAQKPTEDDSKAEETVEKLKQSKKPSEEDFIPLAPKGSPLASPDYLRNKPPAYPLTARRKGYKGLVVLRAEVLSDGNPDKIEIRKSSGYTILDEAAFEAVKKWKFKPAMRGDNPIDSWVEIPIRFTLRDG